jgi:hypothetical protein
MGIGKRGSGPPRRPRNPVAKDVRTPLYRPRVEEDKRWRVRVKQEEQQQPTESPEEVDMADGTEDQH